jgi:hypothetical protein
MPKLFTSDGVTPEAWCRGCHAFTPYCLKHDCCSLCHLTSDTNPPNAPDLKPAQLQIYFQATKEPN